MSHVIVKTGAAETVVSLPVVDSAGAVLTGLTTLYATLFRASDGYFYDWTAHTWSAAPSVPYSAALTEVNSTWAPGVYKLAINTALFSSPVTNDRYFVTILQVGASTAKNTPMVGELRVGEIVDKVEANLNTKLASFAGTASAGTTSTITLAGGSSTTNLYRFQDVEITGGTGAGQARCIVDYNGSTNVATVNRPWDTTPDNTSTFALRARSQPVVVESGIASAGGATSITLRSGSSSVADYYVGCEVQIVAGTGAGQAPRVITAYDGGTKVATVATAWATTPNNTSVYLLLPVGRSITVSNLDKTGYGLAAGAVTSSVIATDAIDASQVSAAAVAKITSGLATGTNVTDAQTAINAHTDSATASLASSSALATAQAGITAIQGVGFTAGTDDLHAAHALLAGTATASSLATAQADLTSIKGSGFTTGDDLHSIRARGDSAWITATGFAVPGSAMALTSGEHTLVQALILSDGIPFPGARIDAAITSRPDAAAIASAVAASLASAHGGGSWLTADVSSLATSSAMATAQASLDAIKGVGFVGGTDDLHAAHALLAGAATGSELSTSVSSINGHVDGAVAPLATLVALGVVQTHGDSTWATATGFSVAGDAMTLTGAAISSVQSGLASSANVSASTSAVNAHTDSTVAGSTSTVTSAISAAQGVITSAIAALPGASAIAAAVGALNISGITNRSLLGGALNALRQLGFNRFVFAPAPASTETLYADDGTTPLAVATVTDASGNAASSPAGAPARRSAFS